jgi:hypothetical protein
MVGGWRKLHNEELHNLYFLPSIIRTIKSRRMMASHEGLSFVKFVSYTRNNESSGWALLPCYPILTANTQEQYLNVIFLNVWPYCLVAAYQRNGAQAQVSKFPTHPVHYTIMDAWEVCQVTAWVMRQIHTNYKPSCTEILSALRERATMYGKKKKKLFSAPGLLWFQVSLHNQ